MTAFPITPQGIFEHDGNKPVKHGYGVDKEDVLARGNVLHCPFWEGAGSQVADVSGNGNHGTLTNGPVWVPEGIAGGLNDAGSVVVADKPELDGFSGLSLMIYAKNNASSIGGTGNESLAEKSGSGADSYRLLWLNTEDIFFQVGTSAGNVSLSETDWLTDDLWHLWIATYDGSTMRMYKDGLEASSTSAQTGAVNATGHDLHLLGDGGNGSWNGIGAIASVWNRALAVSEIAQLSRDPYALLRRRSRRRFVAAAPGGLSIPVAMHHYTKNLRAG